MSKLRRIRSLQLHELPGAAWSLI